MPALLIAAFVVQLACAASGVAEEPATLTKLSFLEGVWVNDGDEITSEEHWTSANGNALLGMHKDVREGRMTSFEFSRIDLDESGAVTYFASPGGAQPTRFRMTRLTSDRVVFENLEHDFRSVSSTGSSRTVGSGPASRAMCPGLSRRWSGDGSGGPSSPWRVHAVKPRGRRSFDSASALRTRQRCADIASSPEHEDRAQIPALSLTGTSTTGCWGCIDFAIGAPHPRGCETSSRPVSFSKRLASQPSPSASALRPCQLASRFEAYGLKLFVSAFVPRQPGIGVGAFVGSVDV